MLLDWFGSITYNPKSVSIGSGNMPTSTESDLDSRIQFHLIWVKVEEPESLVKR